MNILGVSTIVFCMLLYFIMQKNLFQEKSELLLLSILPEEIVEILKQTPVRIADNHAVGEQIELWRIEALFQPAILARWAPWVAAGALMLVIARRVPHELAAAGRHRDRRRFLRVALADGQDALTGMLLNASAIEVATERDVDLDRDLQGTGVANILAAAGGGGSAITCSAGRCSPARSACRDRRTA